MSDDDKKNGDDEPKRTVVEFRPRGKRLPIAASGDKPNADSSPAKKATFRLFDATNQLHNTLFGWSQEPAPSRLREFYNLTIGDFMECHASLLAFLQEGRTKIDEDMRKVKTLFALYQEQEDEAHDGGDDEPSVKAEDDPIRELGGKLAEKIAAVQEEIRELLKPLQEDYRCADPDALFQFRDEYKDFKGYGKKTSPAEGARRFLYERCHDAMEHFYGRIPKLSDAPEVHESFCQFADAVASQTLGASYQFLDHVALENDQRSAYDIFDPDPCPNFFAFRQDPAQEKAWQMRSTAMPLWCLIPPKLREGGKKYGGVDAKLQKQLAMRVPIIRGLEWREQYAYFLRALKRFAPDMESSFEQQMIKADIMGHAKTVEFEKIRMLDLALEAHDKKQKGEIEAAGFIDRWAKSLSPDSPSAPTKS